MKLRHPVAAGVAAVLFAAGQASAADATAGKTVFRQQCALCHSAEPNDGGGAQGPGLQGVFGRTAASGSGFSYTPALRNAKLTWDAGTLDRFLASPTTVVPGSAMVIPVADTKDRENVIAYFSELKAGTFKEAQRPQRAFGGGAPRVPKAPVGEAEWKTDAPGKIHRVDLKKLPAPLAGPEEAAMNFPRVVPRPEGAELKVPAGFKVETFASEGLQGPREMQLAPNGDIFLVETNAGRIKVLRTGADGKLAGTDEFATGLLQPYGMAFYPANKPQWLYVAEVNRVVRYAYKDGDRKAASVPEVVVAQLSPKGGGHFT
ncbi:MAG: c-type cytochrome, partial [Steroidobacteraceae bacterium]